MKYHTTKKAIMNGYTNTIKLPYCAVQHLLVYDDPIAYTTRREGWAADIYHVNNNTAIVTGYSAFGTIQPGYDIYSKYDNKARAILNEYRFKPDISKKKLNKLLNNFIKEVTEKDPGLE